MTKTCLLDYDSIAGADKFGNIFVLRVPADVSDDVDNPTGVTPFLDILFLNWLVDIFPAFGHDSRVGVPAHFLLSVDPGVRIVRCSSEKQETGCCGTPGT